MTVGVPLFADYGRSYFPVCTVRRVPRSLRPQLCHTREKPTLTPTRQLHNNQMVYVVGQVQGVRAGVTTAAMAAAAAAGVRAPWSAL